MNIIIVKYKNPEAEERCLQSVRQFTDLTKHTLTVFDNAPNNVNLGKLWNRLIEESKEDNICLLNSDTVVEDGWTRLEESLADLTVGAVGSLTNKCSTVQATWTRADEIRPVAMNQLSGFCYLLRKSVWRKVGKFPEDFPFYGQESAFNVKLHDHGYKTVIDRRVFIWHEKGSSWHKAKARGEMTMDQVYMAGFHYRNFVRRLKTLRESIPQGTRVVFLGAGGRNSYPTFVGIDQTIADFFGSNAVRLPMETTADVILAFEPSLLLVVNTRYQPEWYEEIKAVKRSGVKTALYYMDLRSPSRANYATRFQHPLTDYFDKVFIVAKGFVDDWKEVFKVDVEWLPQATIQHPVPPRDPEEFCVVHIGDIDDQKYHQNRLAAINQFRDSNIHVHNFNSPRPVERRAISARSYGLYGRADFSLSISPLVEGYTSDRTYHILGAGGCILMLDPGGLDHLKPYGLFGVDVATLIALAKQTTKKEREAIKEKAWDYAQSHHLYKDRYIHIIKSLTQTV